MLLPAGIVRPASRDLVPVVNRVLSGPRKIIASTNHLQNTGTKELVIERIAANTTWYAPATFAGLVSMRGVGGRGYPADSYYVQSYQEEAVNTQYFYGGGSFNSTSYATGYGPVPNSYCGTYIPPTPDRNGTQTCFYYTDTSYWQDTPEVYGGSSSMFGKNFLGGYGSYPAYQEADVSTIVIEQGIGYQALIGNSGGSGEIILEYYK